MQYVKIKITGPSGHEDFEVLWGQREDALLVLIEDRQKDNPHSTVETVDWWGD